jgi:RimJ/RimL family protein N-acetyltransferase
VKAGLDFALKEFNLQQLRLTVALFNQRAISVYEKIGFGIRQWLLTTKQRKRFKL